jgi:hypothetical protein
MEMEMERMRWMGRGGPMAWPQQSMEMAMAIEMDLAMEAPKERWRG